MSAAERSQPGSPRYRLGVLTAWIGLAAVLYASLALLWPAVGDVYRPAVQALANGILAPLARPSGIDVSFSDFHRSSDEGPDTKIVLARSGTTSGRILLVDTRRKAWLPLAVLVALVVATPLPGRRRTGALASGAVLYHLVLLLRLGLFVLALARRRRLGHRGIGRPKPPRPAAGVACRPAAGLPSPGRVSCWP